MYANNENVFMLECHLYKSQSEWRSGMMEARCALGIVALPKKEHFG